jgi:SAM-dependent methyltransferase
MSAWKTFYEGREGHGYQQYVEKRYAPFLKAIGDRIRPSDLVLELGAGTGTITKALNDEHGWREIKLAATDVCPEMLKITRDRLSDAADVAVFQMDALCPFPSKGDVVHSMGMLEHFSDDMIRKIIRRHSHARVQVHYVPGLYDAPTFGDERLMSVEAWWKICRPSQIITFNDGLDYVLIFEGLYH